MYIFKKQPAFEQQDARTRRLRQRRAEEIEARVLGNGSLCIRVKRDLVYRQKRPSI
jgi:hypothetical protein